MTPEENSIPCKSCKGDCCKRYAGALFPEDLFPRQTYPPFRMQLKKKLYDLLRSGDWQVDSWDGDPREEVPKWDQPMSECLYIRPAHTNSRGKVYDRSWGGTCVFLTSTGCPFAFKDRPMMCRKLIASVKFPDGCDYKEKDNGKARSALAWLPWQDLIREVADKVDREKRVPA